jgi:hypothetical protein
MACWARRLSGGARHEHHQPVAQLLDGREAGKFEQGDRVLPFVQPASCEHAHASPHPAHPIAEAKLLHQLERRPVGLADEMIETLKRKAAEIEVRRHSSRNHGRIVEGRNCGFKFTNPQHNCEAYGLSIEIKPNFTRKAPDREAARRRYPHVRAMRTQGSKRGAQRKWLGIMVALATLFRSLPRLCAHRYKYVRRKPPRCGVAGSVGDWASGRAELIRPPWRDAAFGAATPTEPKSISLAIRLLATRPRGQQRRRLCLFDNYPADLNHTVIMDVEETTTISQAEIGAHAVNLCPIRLDIRQQGNPKSKIQ